MDESPMNNLPQETLHQIFSSLTLREIVACRSVCRSFRQTLTSPSFISLLLSSKPPLSLIALRPPPHRHHHSLLLPPPPQPSFPAFDPSGRRWLRFDLSFLPFRSLHPVASAAGLVYLWASDPFPDLTASPPSNSNKSLLACNPLTRQFKVLPQLGSAWSRHGAVLVDYDNRVMVLMEPAALYLPDIAADSWVTFASNLPAKPRSPVLISSSVFALCDVGSPWRSQWKLFTCTLNLNNSVPVHEQLGVGVGSGSGVFSSCSSNHNNWVCLEKHEWADIFDLIKRPRLVRGDGNKLLMIGGLKSTFSLNPSCSTMLILRLDLEKLEWEEAGRMPLEMYRCFLESSKLKVFGGGDRVCFSAKRLGKIALWDDSGSGKEGEGEGAAWRWIDEVPGGGDGISRGFTYDARLTALP